MVVLQYNSTYDFLGGAEKYYIELTKELRRKGFKVFRTGLTTNPENIPTQEDIPIKVKFYEKHLPFTYSIYKRFKNILEETKPDIVHLHNIFYSPLSILKALKEYKEKANVKIIQTVHDYWILCPSGFGVYKDSLQLCNDFRLKIQCLTHKCLSIEKFLRYLVSYGTVRELLKELVNVFISPSKHLAENLYTTFKGKDILVIRNFLDLRNYEYAGYSRYDKGNLLYIGAIETHKGIYQILEAVEYLVKEREDIKLTIAGKGKEEKKLREAIDRKGLKDFVEYLGFVEPREVKELYKKAHIVVVPSLWLENSPFVIYEAMATGKYIIGSERGGVYELIKEANCGSTVNVFDVKKFAEEIKRVLELDKEKLEEAGRNGRNFAENNFNLEKHLEKLIEIYSSSLSTKNLR